MGRPPERLWRADGTFPQALQLGANSIGGGPLGHRRVARRPAPRWLLRLLCHLLGVTVARTWIKSLWERPRDSGGVG